MIRTVLLSVLSFGVVMATHAQVWRPDKPIEIVVPTTPGGGIDANHAGECQSSVICAGGQGRRH